MEKILKIKNAIPEAEEIYNNILNTQYDWWFHAIRYGGNKPEFLRYSLHSRKERDNVESKLKASLAAEHFTYRYTRNMGHKALCDCYMCNLIPQVLSDKFSSMFGPVKLDEIFISIYEPGDFLSLHHDQTKGTAFSWNLTKDWKREYGGSLHIEVEEEHTVVIEPHFNELCIFNIGDDFLNHYVSEVSSFALTNRIAIVGWFYPL